MNRYGSGEAYYVCADMESGFYDDVYRQIADRCNCKSLIEAQIPAGIEVTSRHSEKYTYLFIQNFNAQSAAIDLNSYKDHIIHGDYDGNINAYATIVIKLPV